MRCYSHPHRSRTFSFGEFCSAGHFFTRATLDSAGITCRHVSVCPSVTSRRSTETAKRRITQTTPRDSLGL